MPPEKKSLQPTIRVLDVHKSFGALQVLKGVSFDVHRGSVVSMIGASGSGKSTLLRCINHLEVPTQGEVFIDGEPLGTVRDSAGRTRASASCARSTGCAATWAWCSSSSTCGRT